MASRSPPRPPLVIELRRDAGLQRVLDDAANQRARDITRMARAVTNGFRVAAAAGDDTDFEHAADMAADALEHLIRTLIAEVANV